MLKAKFTNACAVGTAELTVRVYDLPVLNQSSTTTVLCQTGIATFNAFDLSHDSDFTYVWKNLSSGAVIGNTAQIAIGFGGTYDVTSFEIKITDPESGCAKADTVKVKFVQDVAPAILAHAKEICLGDRVQLIGTGGKNFLWSTGEVTDRIWVKPTTVGYHKYSLVVDNGNECSERETFTYVKVNPLPIVKAHTSKTVNICAGRSIRLYPSGAKTYTWAHDPTVEGSIIVSPSVTTLYTVTGYDGNGCSSIDDVLIVVSPIADLGADKQLCQGESTEIGIPVLQGATYLWLPTGERTNKITVRRSGKYELRVKIDSCEFNDFITIDFKASPQPKVVKDTIICFDNDEAHAIQASIRNLDATITYLYQWYDTAGTLVGFTDKLDLDSAGTYRLKVTALYPHPCTGEVSTKVSDMCAPEIYIPEAFSPNGDGLNDEFTIFGKHYENLSMTVYNRWNEIVFSVKAKNASEMKYWDGKFKGENAPDGLYQYTITYTSEERQDQTQTIIGSVLIVR
jgi:gliding motility-associated-like protein